MRRNQEVCACGHYRDVHCRPMFKGEREWCAHICCNCAEFTPYVPDGIDR